MAARPASSPWSLAALVLALACNPRQAPPQSGEILVLTRGLHVERTLSGGGSHRFRFEIAAHRLLRLSVEQQGLDIVAFVYDPRGELLFESDAPTGAEGSEPLEIATGIGGEYSLVIEPYKSGVEGLFVVVVEELREADEDDRRRAEALAALARAERRRQEQDFAAAAAGWEQALPWLEASGDRQAAAETRWHLGEACAELGELWRALPHLETAASQLRELGDTVGEARVLNDLGTLRRSLGHPDQAAAAHQRSLELYRHAGISNGEATALNNLGLVAETAGDLARAADFYEQALALWRQLDRPSAEAVTRQNLGNLYSLVGRNAEALDLLEQALAQLEGEADVHRRMTALVSLGWAHYLNGKPEAALDRYAEALALARQLGDRLGEAGVLDRQGTALRVLGRGEQATAAYDRALRIFESAGSRLGQGHTLANLGWLELAQGRPQAAVERLRPALEILSEVGDRNGAVYTLVGLARAARQRGELETARGQLERAVAWVETLRTEVPGTLSRSYFLATRYDAFEELVTLLMELDRREPGNGHGLRALEITERARARGLLESLTRATDIQGRASAEDRRSRLLAEIRALDERRMTLVAETPQSPAVDQLSRALRERYLALERLEGDPKPPSTPPVMLGATEIQALAERDALVVVYFLAEPESFAWTLDRDRIESHRLPDRRSIELRARRLAATLPRSGESVLTQPVAAALTAMSDAVLAPLASRLEGHQRLILLPDGALHLMPFAALPQPPASAGTSSRPLIWMHEVVTVPSASVLAWQRRTLPSRPRPTGEVAVIADPVFSSADERLSGTATAKTALPADLERALEVFDLRRLERLPATALEAEAVLAHVPRGKTLRALDFDANRELAESDVLGDYRILHFATHGLLHPVHPGLSGIVLSLVDEQGHPRDGFLRAHDIAALRLPADLVVLSACQTGLGHEIRGEGLVGLSQAFFTAGAHRLIVSLWKVSDASTARLMATFYQHLFRDRLSPAAALRRAQLALLADDATRAPYYWAGFGVLGEGW